MIALLVFLTIVAVAADIAVAMLLLRWSRSRYRRRYDLQIDNLGNVAVSFDLRVRPADDGLFLSFGDGIIVPEGADVGPVSEQVQAPVQKVASASNAASAGEMAGGTVKKIRGASQVVSSMVAGIGGLLPASVGQPLRNLAAEMQQRQVQINRIENAPRQTARRVKSVTRAGRSQRSNRRSAGSTPPRAGVQAGPATSKSLWGQTKRVVSGESAKVKIQAVPQAWPRETREYPITIESYVVGQPTAPIAREEARIRISGVSLFGHAWPYLLFALALVLETWLLVWLFTGIA
ncbi:MAG: hypothetical protein MUQ10_15670 [Anaerolineae bacterium]|nr:hypothetical protein [Anaerolineae bacterium]